MHRGQATITAIEAAIGVLLVLSLSFAFAVGDPGQSNPAGQAQLDAYAEDVATLLVHEQPRHADQTRLAEVTASEAAFDREADALERRVEAILPENLLFQIETGHGNVGHPLPADATTGVRTVLTRHGTVTLRVWYV